MPDTPSPVNLPPVFGPDIAHLLVVDDDRRLRTLLQAYLTDSGFLVTSAVDAADARAKLGLFLFDLIVLDVMMKGESGLSLLASLRAEGQQTPVLLLTARAEAEDRIGGLEAGADDYLTKPFEPKELVLRIQSILRRQRPVAADLPPSRPLRLGRWIFDPARDELTEKDGHGVVRLSGVEAGLLRTLGEKPGTIISRDDLVTRQPLAGNARTIDVQVTRLRRKFEVDPKQPRYLLTVRGEGYVLRPGE